MAFKILVAVMMLAMAPAARGMRFWRDVVKESGDSRPDPIGMLPDDVAAQSLPRGNAAWTYDQKTGAAGMWASVLRQYNSNGTAQAHQISVVYSYGGDMEYYPSSANPYQTYFSQQSQQAAEAYATVADKVILIVDGRMDGGQSWSPDLSALNTTQVQDWADFTAALYCSYSAVDGIQIDLEPFEAPYVDNLLVFLARLSQGRSLGAFMFASAATPAVFDALGPNGYATISGYDLSNNPAGTPSSPSEYQEQIADAVATISKSAGSDYFFTIGIPGSASTHEFESYTTGGTTVQGSPVFDAATQSGYVVDAIEAIQSAGVKQSKNYLGTSLWGFNSMMSYPGGTYNLYYPSTPFTAPGEEEYLQNNL